MAIQQALNDIVTVRIATSRDRGRVRQIECACFGHARLLFGLWQRVGQRVAWRDTLTLIAEVNGTPAGYLIAYPHELEGEPETYIGGVGVLPQYRKRGLGTRLMQAVLAEHISLWLHVRAGNPAAIAMYRRLGMCELQRLIKFYSNGDDALVMVTPGLLQAQERRTALDSIYNVI